jgi:hypothetical protein
MALYDHYSKKHGSFTTNQIAGFITEQCLQDLRINNFTFPGIPRIEARRVGKRESRIDIENDVFEVLLSVDEHIQTIEFSFREGADMGVYFKKAKTVDTKDSAFNRCQKALQKLENSYNYRDQNL